MHWQPKVGGKVGGSVVRGLAFYGVVKRDVYTQARTYLTRDILFAFEWRNLVYRKTFQPFLMWSMVLDARCRREASIILENTIRRGLVTSKVCPLLWCAVVSDDLFLFF